MPHPNGVAKAAKWGDWELLRSDRVITSSWQVLLQLEIRRVDTDNGLAGWRQHCVQ